MSEEEKEELEDMIKDVFFWKGSSNFIKRSEYKKLVEKLYQENKELKEKIKEYEIGKEQ